ncbi:MAG: AmmeMemoRadiSam system radical SAM enzyme [Desulfuromonadales bacterium]|uniref:AmmeMemoRadiSam system radical SAM enzyme n=1 Tax=Desulfuromonas sp. KJ2020 TaxID=2919173 RepID=UPI00032194E5|nr:AmmeMemoRadiSam system radical SAM enzyme [Desulfuromonas sp. KJ2020]MCP3177325.1 AmmeMemoRadiSam system radical SAM enzyme [Desulfuromonas sp. KJ2020]
MREAAFWEKKDSDKTLCTLCRHHCLIAAGKRGLCGVRENRDGILYSLVYEKLIAENVDHIEKKPLFHYLPGSTSYSIATVGCNFHCRHCQNYDISQWGASRGPVPGEKVSPADLVQRALAAGCRSISYTYTEPTIFYEYAYDTAVLAKEAGLGNVFVSNGYTGTAALEQIAPYLDAANIDLKGFTEDFYREVAGARLQGVLDTLRDYRRLGIWLEVTTLLIPGHNDSDEELRALAGFVCNELGAQVPWHVTAFYPTYKMLDVPRTPVETLRRARQIGLEAGLKYVYEGNVPGEGGENTFCPGCKKKIISRVGYRVDASHLDRGRCDACGHLLDGVWF